MQVRIFVDQLFDQLQCACAVGGIAGHGPSPSLIVPLPREPQTRDSMRDGVIQDPGPRPILQIRPDHEGMLWRTGLGRNAYLAEDRGPFGFIITFHNAEDGSTAPRGPYLAKLGRDRSHDEHSCPSPTTVATVVIWLPVRMGSKAE